MARPGRKHKITHICAGCLGFAAELNSSIGKKQIENLKKIAVVTIQSVLTGILRKELEVQLGL